MKHTRESVAALVNECREKGTRIDLSGQDLSSLDLSGLDLSGADLRGIDLRWADLQDANLRGANLRGINLRSADLRGTDLQDANLRWADLKEADLRRADLQETDLQETDLRGADLRWADLQDANLRGANLRGANLQGTDLRDANLQEANLDFTGYELSCRTIGIIADSRLVSQLLYHLCRMDVRNCPEWDELRNDERVIALANQSHVITTHKQPEIEPLKKGGRMPSKIVITFTEKEESVETKISTETSGTALENEAAKILKQDVVELFYRILNESEQEEE